MSTMCPVVSKSCGTFICFVLIGMTWKHMHVSNSIFSTFSLFLSLSQYWPQEWLASRWHGMISAPETHGNSVCRWAIWWRFISSVLMDGGKARSMAGWEPTCIHLKPVILMQFLLRWFWFKYRFDWPLVKVCLFEVVVHSTQ